MNTQTETAVDLVWFIQRASKWSRPTRADYVRSVRRLPDLMGRTRMDDIEIDLEGFETRFTLDGFNPEHFASQDAYRAWRRKLMASVKAFVGQSRPRSYDDEWSVLLRAVEVFTLDHPEFHVSDVLKLSTVAAAARKIGAAPQELDNAAISQISEFVPSKIYKEIVSGVKLMNRLRDAPESPLHLLPLTHLEVPKRDARRKLPAPPDHLSHELEAWIENYCTGGIDEITAEEIGGKSSSTANVYRAAGRKYLGFAHQLGLLEGVSDLTATLHDEIAKPTLRAMLTDRNSPTSISLRSARAYLDSFLRLARANGHDAPVISRALASNRELKSGQQVARQMSPKAKQFCAWLMTDRSAEMKYRSFHLRMRALHGEMISRHEAGERYTYFSERLQQVACLAAMSAIWVWGPPLRVENICGLRLYGNAPQIWMPKGKSRNIDIAIEASQTKNSRRINQRILYGRHRAIETIMWYIDEVRPGMPQSKDSIFMFPSKATSEKPVGTGSVRDWLDRHSREVGLPIKPHLFRHAAASLYIRSHPGAYDHVAQLLDDSPQVVRRFYAWIDDMAVLDDVQANILKHAGFVDA